MTKRHNIWSHFRLAALLAVLVLALCGCSSDDVRLPERVDLFRGQQFALASAVEIEGDPDAADVLAALAAADAHGVTVDFASADESVATVDEFSPTSSTWPTSRPSSVITQSPSSRPSASPLAMVKLFDQLSVPQDTMRAASNTKSGCCSAYTRSCERRPFSSTASMPARAISLASAIWLRSASFSACRRS